VLFDVLSAGADRGDQAEDDGLANKTVLYFCEIIFHPFSSRSFRKTLATRRDAESFDVPSPQP
jgi:hypothetical protein